MALQENEERIICGTGPDFEVLYSAAFNTKDRTIRKLAENPAAKGSTWVSVHPVNPEIFYYNSSIDSKIFCAQIDKSGKVTILDEATLTLPAKGPATMTVVPDNSALVIANYVSGNVSLLPLNKEGRLLAKATEPSHDFNPPFEPLDHPRHNQPRSHQTIVYGEDVFVPDLGSNKTWQLGFGGPDDKARWVLKNAIGGLNPGDGPRHVCVHPSGKVLYVLNEISQDLTAHSIPEKGGESKLLSRHSIVPPEDKENITKMKSAALVYLPPLEKGGKGILVATNRDTPRAEGDAIAVFTFDDEGKVERSPVPFVSGGGKHIRGAAIDMTGRFVATTAMNGGGLTIFERTGKNDDEMKKVAQLDVPGPVACVWVQ